MPECTVPKWGYHSIGDGGVATEYLVVGGRARSYRKCVNCGIIEYWEGEDSNDGIFIELGAEDEYCFMSVENYGRCVSGKWNWA